MKRVFEGIVFERRRIGDNAIGACTTEAFEEFYQSLPIGKATRITVEDLSESKSSQATDKLEPLKPERWPGKTPIAYDKEGNAVVFGPEKNCGNCRHWTRCHSLICSLEETSECDFSPSRWQPKVAEPQSWEQRFSQWYMKCKTQMAKDDYDKLLELIRDEIERVRDEEKQAVIKWLKNSATYSWSAATCIEQNEHRSEK